MLKQRVMTAALLLPVALAGFFWLQGPAFALFIGLIVALGGWEWAQLAGLSDQRQRLGYGALVAALALLLYLLPSLAGLVMLLGVFWWGMAIALVLGFPGSSRHWTVLWRRLLMGLLILLPAWQGMILLKQEPHGNGLILSVMALVWVADIGAYFSGRAFGKRKLAPHVSPGKSWEGLLGGLLACVLMTAGVGLYQQWSAGGVLYAMLGAALVVLVSVLGDLTESMFKRQAGIKDSSNLLPGHGGVLDRIDSLTAAIPVFVTLLWLAERG